MPSLMAMIDMLSDGDRRAIRVVVTAQNVASVRAQLLHIFRRTGPISRDWPMLVDAREVDAGDAAAVHAVTRLVAQASSGVFVKRALVGSRALVTAVARNGPARFGQFRGFLDVESAVPWVLDQVPSFGGMLRPPVRRSRANGDAASHGAADHAELPDEAPLGAEEPPVE